MARRSYPQWIQIQRARRSLEFQAIAVPLGQPPRAGADHHRAAEQEINQVPFRLLVGEKHLRRRHQQRDAKPGAGDVLMRAEGTGVKFNARALLGEGHFARPYWTGQGMSSPRIFAA